MPPGRRSSRGCCSKRLLRQRCRQSSGWGSIYWCVHRGSVFAGRDLSAAYCRLAPGHPVHGVYHDTEYGFPTSNESVLFERLILEINQAGLSWLTILRKRAAFGAAFAEFDVDRVAAFEPADVDRLLSDSGIIRNRLKIEATIENAIRIQALRRAHGSFAAWLDAHHPRFGGGMDAALSPDFSFYRRADRQRVPDEHLVPSGSTCAGVPSLFTNSRIIAAMGTADCPGSTVLTICLIRASLAKLLSVRQNTHSALTPPANGSKLFPPPPSCRPGRNNRGGCRAGIRAMSRQCRVR